MNKENKNNKSGFTLLELLVVVIIIGILAAIALPQYQLSIDKSKFAGYSAMAKNLADAYWRYLYTKSVSPSNIENLDIDLPKGYTKTSPSYQSCIVYDDMYCCILRPKSNYQWGGTVCGSKDNNMAVILSLLIDSNAELPRNYIRKFCYAKTNNARAIRLCESMPYTTKNDNDHLPTQTEHKGGYTRYILKN